MANHPDPESCGVRREAQAEALTATVLKIKPFWAPNDETSRPTIYPI